MTPDELPLDQLRQLTRRTIIGGAAAALTAIGLDGPAAAETTLDLDAGGGYWLGQRFWGNRTQDWTSQSGTIRCVAAPGEGDGRTVGILTAEVRSAPFTLVVQTAALATGSGFSGFVIGTGIPGEDPRRRALVGSASGTGGGIIASYDDTGRLAFLDHTDELDPFAYAALPSTTVGTARPRGVGQVSKLILTGRPDGSDKVILTLSARAASGEETIRTTLPSIALSRVRGGISLMSHSRLPSNARFSFAGFAASGTGIVSVAERGLGPVMGTLFTSMERTLRMTVQLMPVDPRSMSTVSLEVLRGGTWRRQGTSPIGPGYTALFRVTGFDTSVATGYRIVDGKTVLYGGTIPAEPRSGRLRLASVNCTKASHRPTDSLTPWDARLPGSTPLDLYSVRNIYFPHNELVASLTKSKPDLIVAHGDQLYETSPTAKDRSRDPELDYLYKFLLWHWSMRPLTRRLPTIVLTDDHDMYQGNLWGEGGIPTTVQETGGYVNSPEWVNLVQRISSWHNPERYDATPIAQGISVLYSAFSYGGTSFAVVEDRKFKTGPEGDISNPQLLGGRQEAFLGAWRTMHPGQPKVILTQTAWACVQTDVDGQPKADLDSDGWPAAGRLRAVTLAGAAKALIVSGDQHLGSLIRHGINGFTDGPIQFTPPAASTSFQRWFQPANALPNAGPTPNTGDFTDAFGNKMRVLGVVNPRFTLRQLWEYFPQPRQDFGDRSLKREGFGMLLFNHNAKSVVLECWPWNTAATGDQQYAGWPVTLPYSDF